MEYTSHLSFREYVWDKLRFHTLREPLSTRHKPAGIASATIETKLPNDAQVSCGSDRLSPMTFRKPTLDEVAQIGRSPFGSTSFIHMAVKMLQSAFRPLIAESQGMLVIQE
jgi:hypothetical protein